METTRRYRMTRIGDGDYVFPSNDCLTLWRVYRYREDGSAEWGNGGAPILGDFWAAARFEGSFEDASSLAFTDREQFLSWEDWEFVAGPLFTRREAIHHALAIDAQAVAS